MEKVKTVLPLEWIKDLEWHENDKRTDASLEFTIAGMEDSLLKNKLKIDALNDRVVQSAIKKVAHRFCDAVTVDDFGWQVRDLAFASDVDKAIDIWADIHLAYDD